MTKTLRITLLTSTLLTTCLAALPAFATTDGTEPADQVEGAAPADGAEGTPSGLPVESVPAGED